MLSRKSAFASRMLFSSSAFKRIRSTGFLFPTYSSTSSMRSCPSRSGSPAWTISSARSMSPLTIPNCLRQDSATISFHSLGIIGRSSVRHFLYFSSYSSGSACLRMWPKPHVTTPFGVSKKPSPLRTGAPRIFAISLPMLGFSAIYNRIIYTSSMGKRSLTSVRRFSFQIHTVFYHIFMVLSCIFKSLRYNIFVYVHL